MDLCCQIADVPVRVDISGQVDTHTRCENRGALRDGAICMLLMMIQYNKKSFFQISQLYFE
jgi:hypothetical protein